MTITKLINSLSKGKVVPGIT